MAPAEKNVEWQTQKIIECLFDDEDSVKSRVLDCHLETDSPGDENDFDPVIIADKLRAVADALNEDPNFKKALDELKKTAATEATEAAFERGVELLCKSHVAQNADIAPEMQLIQASAAIGLYLKKSYPEMKETVKTAMASFLKNRVGKWLTEKGGWGKVAPV
ncbi:uncharacterized protein LOC112846943 [Oreochromis niloticus]|uniref:uncharacterized protein LOC112846943 n=1 Tax=Oreochromis niloticus TaxID=8128 RepID=UPI00022B1875|nr:uncharacterized protein LOC112846943 [Oreochromis niloticus]